MPVAGPALIEDLRPDLWLEEKGGLANDLHNRRHPAILFPSQERGTLQEVVDQVLLV